MNIIKVLIIFILTFPVLLKAQDMLHPTIQKLEVQYQMLDGAGIEMQVKPTAHIILKDSLTVSKVYFKMMKMQTNTLLYNVNYNINSAKITNEQGVVLFEKQGSLIQIQLPNTIALEPYQFEIYTENTQQQASPIFSVIQ